MAETEASDIEKEVRKRLEDVTAAALDLRSFMMKQGVPAIVALYRLSADLNTAERAIANVRGDLKRVMPLGAGLDPNLYSNTSDEAVVALPFIEVTSEGSAAEMSDRGAFDADLRAQLAEARSEAKLSAAMGEIKAEFGNVRADLGYVRAKLDAVEKSTAGIRGTVIGTGIAAVVLVIAVLAYGQTWFGLGVSARDIVRATVTEMRQQQTPVGQGSAPTPPGH